VSSAYEAVMEAGLRRLKGGPDAGVSWERAIRAGLTELMRAVGEDPTATRFALVDAFSAGPGMLREMSLATREFEQFLLDALNSSSRAQMPLPLVQGIAAGAERVVRGHVLADRTNELPAVSEVLADWALSMHDPAIGRLPIPAPPTATKARSYRDARARSRSAHLGALGSERGRMLAATVRISLKSGYWKLTESRIRREAGVTRRAFDAQFAGVSECYLGGIEALVARALVRAERGAADAASWESQVVRFVNAYCTEVARSPALAQLGYIDVFAPGEDGMTCRERMISRGAALLRAGSSGALTELEAEASSAAGWRIIQGEVAEGRVRGLPRIAPLISFAILAPAVGAAAAAKVIHAET
jgi:hypothetical protein